MISVSVVTRKEHITLALQAVNILAMETRLNIAVDGMRYIYMRQKLLQHFQFIVVIRQTMWAVILIVVLIFFLVELLTLERLADRNIKVSLKIISICAFDFVVSMVIRMQVLNMGKFYSCRICTESVLNMQLIS